MKEPKFKKGAIVVAIKEEKTGCGIRYIRKNSILKMAEDIYENEEVSGIYRNRREELSHNIHYINTVKLRAATEKEDECYEKGIYYTDQVPV